MAAEEEKPPRRFLIGYALARKKQYSFIQHSLISVAGSRGIDLVPIDISIPLVDQGPFDCVIHKLCGENWAAQVEAFSSLHPEIPVIDSPAAIERLHNRISMLQVVSEIKISEENRSDTFGIPSQVVIYDAAALADPSGVVCDALQFPVIAKPLIADGSAKSHKMALIFHRDGLRKLKPPLVLQEFVNHGGVIFKVYVVGDYVQCVKRRSLPDVSEEKLESTTERSLSFSQVSNVPSQDLAVAAEEVCLDEVEMPPLGLLTDIAHGLRQELRLSLFNFDVIRDVRVGNRYLVIDINYFPGYAKMPSYEDVLTDFFWKILNKENAA